MAQMLAEYKVGKAVYQIRPDGFVDNINPLIPNMDIVYSWDRVYAAMEYERERNPRTGMVENVIRWMRVYDKKGSGLIAQMAITDALRDSMYRFYEVFLDTQEKALKRQDKPSNVHPIRPEQRP